MPLITNKMIYDGLTQNVAATQRRLQSAQAHAASGQRVMEAADDPTAAARGTVIAFGLSQLDGMREAAVTVRQALSVADQTLQQTSTFLGRAKELAIAGANGGFNDRDRQAMAVEVGQLHDAILQVANTQVDGKFIFGGYQQDSAPFAADGTFSGDQGANQLEVAPGLMVTGTISGADTFNVAGGANVLGMLQTLQSGLMTGDIAQVREGIDGSDAAIAQISTAQGNLGAQMGQLLAGDNARETALQTLSTALDDQLQVDMAKSFSDMLQAQAAYQAAVAEATRILTGLGNSLTQ